MNDRHEAPCPHDDFVTRPIGGGMTRFICLDCGEESDVGPTEVTLTEDERQFLLRAVRMVKHETEHPTVEATLDRPGGAR